MRKANKMLNNPKQSRHRNYLISLPTLRIKMSDRTSPHRLNYDRDKFYLHLIVRIWRSETWSFMLTLLCMAS